jgi:hypothetical protein
MSTSAKPSDQPISDPTIPKPATASEKVKSFLRGVAGRSIPQRSPGSQ